MSAKASPWENGYQEACYSQFQVDLGDPNRYKTLGELVAVGYLQIHYITTIQESKNAASDLCPAAKSRNP
jgi:hypothetical protein